jgi:hypothetical protein
MTPQKIPDYRREKSHAVRVLAHRQLYGIAPIARRAGRVGAR